MKAESNNNNIPEEDSANSHDAQVTLAEKRSKLQRRRAGSLMAPAAENPERYANRRKSFAVARERYPTNIDCEELGAVVG